MVSCSFRDKRMRLKTRAYGILRGCPHIVYWALFYEEVQNCDKPAFATATTFKHWFNM